VVRFTVRRMLVAVALLASLLAGERLWQRSVFYRKQAAVCAFFEMQLHHYAAQYEKEPWDGPIEELRESIRMNRSDAQRFGNLKEIYARVARRPWESLPAGTPESVNPLDLWPLTASELEEMVKAGYDD
jgi:hypothetical protein